MICPVCESKDPRLVLEKESLVLARCAVCGVVFLNDLQNIFDSSRYDYYKDRVNQAQNEIYNPITTKRYAALLKRLEDFRKSSMLLDVGCGEGQFLNTAKSLGWLAKGLDLSPYAVEICKKFGADASCIDFLGPGLESKDYDIVTMFEVLEHLTRPKEYLLKTNAILRKGGVLVITTPNFDSITRMLLSNKWSVINAEHLFYFTSASIKRLITGCGFRIIDFKVKNITLPEYSKLFSRNSGEAYKENQQLRELAESNRFLSFLKTGINHALNITRLGETIECICQKI